MYHTELSYLFSGLLDVFRCILRIHTKAAKKAYFIQDILLYITFDGIFTIETKDPQE